MNCATIYIYHNGISTAANASFDAIVRLTPFEKVKKAAWSLPYCTLRSHRYIEGSNDDLCEDMFPALEMV